jgi:hypothetical protein
MSISDRIYSGAIEAERAKTFIQAIIGTFCGIVILICGTYLFFKKDNLTEKAKATIISNTCSKVVQENVVSYKCMLDLSYIVNGVTYTPSINTMARSPYTNGTIIDIKYNPDNKNEVEEDNSQNKIVSIVLSVVAILMIGGGWLWYYMNKKYEAVAGYSAISDVSGIFRSR